MEGGISTVSSIDLAAGVARMMDDRDLLLRVLARFAGDYRDLGARLHAALGAGDTVLAQRIVHTLKGAAGMIEAARLRRLAQGVELALKADGVAPPPLLAALDGELARVLADVDTVLAAPGTPEPAAAPPAAPDNLARLRAMLDIGDGRALDLAAQLRPCLHEHMKSEDLAAFDAALKRFDFEGALALLERCP